MSLLKDSSSETSLDNGGEFSVVSLFKERELTKLKYQDLDTYRKEMFALEDDLLKGIMPNAIKLGLPNISVNPEAGKMLFLLAKMIKAKKILEFGTLAGYSGVWLARALPPDGQFITLEIDSNHAKLAHENFVAANLADLTEVRIGGTAQLEEGLISEGPFDLVFIDADKGEYPIYLDFALNNTRLGGLIIADNANGHGGAHELLDENDSRRGIQIYNEKVSKNPNLISNIIPVGGWLAVSLVVGLEE